MSQIISGERRISREALLDRGARAAAGLKALGVEAGDTVALFLRNDIAFLEAALAAGQIGAYPVAVNWHSTPPEAQYIFADCAPKVVVIHADFLPAIGPVIPASAATLVVETPVEIRLAYGLPHEAGAPPPGSTVWSDWLEGCDPLTIQSQDPPSTIIYTSGTTGRPKGVRRNPPTPAEAEEAARVVGISYGLRPGPDPIVTIVAAPLYHSAPNAQALFAVKVGATIVLQPRFDAEELLRLIERERATHLYLPPIMFSRLLQLPVAVRGRYDVSSLKFVVHAAAPCPPDVKRAMIEWWGPVINEFYGATETRAVTFCTSPEWLERPGTVGRAITGATLRVVDDQGRDQPPGQPGEILSRHMAVADFTYHGDDEKRRAVGKQGLLAVGDVGYLDEDGYLFICDRNSDMIISGGVNIYPAEVEAVLSQAPGVRDCAVFGIPDAEYGEAVMAVVQPLDGASVDGDDLRAYLRGRVAGYKIPRRIEVSRDLPREDSGKIFKRKLRAPYWDEAQRRI